MNMKLGLLVLAMVGCGGSTIGPSSTDAVPLSECPWAQYQCGWEAPLASDPLISECMSGFKSCDPNSPCTYLIDSTKVTLVYGNLTKAVCFSPDGGSP